MTGVAAMIAAVVVATSAAAGGGVVLTSDVDDVRALASCATDTGNDRIREAAG